MHAISAATNRLILRVSSLTLAPVTWEEIYHDWPNENYKYYWHDFNMQLSDYDFSYHQERDRLAFEMADVGDERSRSA